MLAIHCWPTTFVPTDVPTVMVATSVQLSGPSRKRKPQVTRPTCTGSWSAATTTDRALLTLGAGPHPIYGRHAHESPLIRAYRRGRGSAVKCSDFLTRREFRATGLYNEFFRPRGIEFRIAKGLPGPAGLVTAVYLDRSARDFSERDRLLLNLLRPHFNQSYRNAAMVSALRDELALVEQGLTSDDSAIALLARDGRPRAITPLARRWLDEHFGAGSTLERGLPEPVRRWMASQVSVRGELPRPPTPLVVEGARSCLAMRLVAREPHRLLLLQRRPRGRPSLAPLGLSRREEEVMAWVAEGKTNAETAAILGLSPRTVDKHLEHIYAKLGVETRMAAAARVRTALAESE